MTDQEFKFKSTIKAGPGYEAPWITVGGSSGPEWEQNLRGALASQAVQLTHELSQQFQGQGSVVNAGAAAPSGWQNQNQQQAQPQAVQQPLQDLLVHRMGDERRQLVQRDRQHHCAERAALRAQRRGVYPLSCAAIQSAVWSR